MQSPILAPLVALAAWTMVMWFWMYLTRLPAIAQQNLKLDPSVPPRELMNQLPPSVRWKADNYNHLMELPTVFYAVVIALALLEQGSGINLTLAWAYVGLRVVHSLVQALWNKIEVRFSVFALSSLVLVALIFNAARAL
jgi:hypothetical protein